MEKTFLPITWIVLQARIISWAMLKSWFRPIWARGIPRNNEKGCRRPTNFRKWKSWEIEAKARSAAVANLEVSLQVERRIKASPRISIRAISQTSKSWLLARARAEIEVCALRGQMDKCSDLWVEKITYWMFQEKISLRATLPTTNEVLLSTWVASSIERVTTTSERLRIRLANEQLVLKSNQPEAPKISEELVQQAERDR